MDFKGKIPVLAFLLIAITCCKKPSPSPQSYALKMGGQRTWHGTQQHQCYACPRFIDTTYDIADTFAITAVNISKVVMPFSSFTSYDTMYYVSADAINKTITFNTGTVNFYYNATIVYYYLKDSIAYTSTLANPSEDYITSLYTQ
jgi:hypothetical protein